MVGAAQSAPPHGRGKRFLAQSFRMRHGPERVAYGIPARFNPALGICNGECGGAKAVRPRRAGRSPVQIAAVAVATVSPARAGASATIS